MSDAEKSESTADEVTGRTDVYKAFFLVALQAQGVSAEVCQVAHDVAVLHAEAEMRSREEKMRFRKQASRMKGGEACG